MKELKNVTMNNTNTVNALAADLTTTRIDDTLAAGIDANDLNDGIEFYNDLKGRIGTSMTKTLKWVSTLQTYVMKGLRPNTLILTAHDHIVACHIDNSKAEAYDLSGNIVAKLNIKTDELSKYDNTIIAYLLQSKLLALKEDELLNAEIKTDNMNESIVTWLVKTIHEYKICIPTINGKAHPEMMHIAKSKETLDRNTEFFAKAYRLSNAETDIMPNIASAMITSYNNNNNVIIDEEIIVEGQIVGINYEEAAAYIGKTKVADLDAFATLVEDLGHGAIKSLLEDAVKRYLNNEI